MESLSMVGIMSGSGGFLTLEGNCCGHLPSPPPVTVVTRVWRKGPRGERGGCMGQSLGTFMFPWERAEGIV